MKALLQKQQQDQAIRNMLAEKSGDRTVEHRVDHCKHLQYEKHQQLFAVYYTTIHKAAMDNSVSGLKHFLKPANAKSQKAAKRGQGSLSDDRSRAVTAAIINQLDEKGNAAIHYAAERDAVDAIEFLVENKCDVDVKSSCGNTALMMASKENKIRAIETLLRSNANSLLTNNTGMNMVHFAAQGDHPQVILTMFEHMAYPYQTIADESDMAVLSMTLSNKKMSETLEDNDTLDGDGSHGSKTGNDEDDDGATIATNKDDRSVLSRPTSMKLGSKLEKKSTTSNPPTGRRTPMVVSQSTTSSTVKMQDETMSFGTGAASKSTFGTKTSTQRELIEISRILQYLLNQPSNNQTTPLHVAAQYNAVRIVRLLMKSGLVEIDSQDSSGETPLHKAARKGYRDLYKLLRSFNAKEDIENIFNEKPKDLLVDSINY